MDKAQIAPVIVELLPNVRSLRLKETLVWCLGGSGVKGLAVPTLIEEFRRASAPSDHHIRWVIGKALADTVDSADAKVFEHLAELLRDDSFGRSREYLTFAVVATRDRRAVDVLLELLRRRQLVGWVIAALRKAKDPRVLSDIERFVDDDDVGVRTEARKTVTALGRIRERRAAGK